MILAHAANPDGSNFRKGQPDGACSETRLALSPQPDNEQGVRTEEHPVVVTFVVDELTSRRDGLNQSRPAPSQHNKFKFYLRLAGYFLNPMK